MKRSCLKTIASLAGFLFALTTASTAAATATRPDVDADLAEPVSGQLVFLEALVNRVPVDGLISAKVSGERIWVNRAGIIELGLKPSAIDAVHWRGEFVDLGALSDVRVDYHPQQQGLVIEAPVAMLARESVHTSDRPVLDEADAEAPATGLLLNYSLHLQRSENRLDLSTGLSAWTEFRVPRRLGVFSSTMLSQWSESRLGGNAGPKHTRLDTTWRSDFPKSTLSVVVGDTATSALTWSRPVRIGGLRVGTDFGLSPYQSTSPLTAFEGQVTLPSTIDVYVGGLLREQLQVLPGSFTIESLTAVDGAGIASLVITDISGQRRTIDVPIYGALNLLKEGLVDWSVEVGAMRTQYGRESFSYSSSPVANGSWRYGLSNSVTLEGHAELGAGTGVLGYGGIVRLGEQGGLLSTSVTSSRSRLAGSGQKVNVGYQWVMRPWRVALQSQRTSPHFSDLSSIDGSLSLSRTDRVFLGWSFLGWDVGLTASQQVDSRSQGVRLAGISLTRQLDNGVRWSVGYSSMMSTTKEERLGVSVVVPLSKGVTASVSTTQRRDRPSATGWQVSKSALAGEDWSWRVSQTAPEGAAQVSASRATSFGQWSSSFDRYSGVGNSGSNTSISTSFSGAVAFVDQRFFLTKTVDSSFALVSTGGLPGIPVRLENQPVGKTDAQGQLFVSPLNPQQRNQLSVDVLDLSYDISAAATTMFATPHRFGGVKVDFAFHRVLSVRASLHDAQGVPLPIGSVVSVVRSPSTVQTNLGPMNVFPRVGHDGEILVENPIPGTRLSVRIYGKRSTCQVLLPEVSSDPIGQIHLGVVSCL